ncbi:MAG: trypsin-like peptidase domain-containing protein [Planctomycetes bacterium]|nr:trypsin-like peptidase domain-containing protein [Planctomycetota bacterium]
MAKTNNTNGEVCARKTLGPLLIAISVLIIVTIVLAFYFSDEIRQSKKNRGQMQIGGFKVAGQMGQIPKITAKPMAFVPPWHGKQSPDTVTGATPKIMSFNQAISIISPSVVGINTSGGQQQSASGIIVHHLGYILTNNHVVKGANNIVVTLHNDRVFKTYPAQIFESRPDLDLAIIKITQTGNEVLSPVPLGDSDKIYIGQQVLTIGNPFGLSQSASSGIISNTNRTLTTGNKTFDGLIQTDASINPGSSGGALVNPQGEVIGVNTAIYSTTQSFSGISFAVPINQAKRAFPDLIEIVQSPLAIPNTQTAKAGTNQFGASVPAGMNLQMMAAKSTARPRCWLGVSSFPVDSVVARELDLPTHHGALVNRVVGNSPAAEAGLMRGDMILRFDNRRVKDEEMLWGYLQGKNAGDKVKIAVLRKGNKEIFVVTLQPEQQNVSATFSPSPQGTQVPQGATVPAATGTLPSPREQNAAGKKFIEGHWLGLEVIPLTAELATEYQIPKGQTGVLVDEVTLEAAESGILAGDMVQSISGFPTPDLETFFLATQRERVQEEKRAQVGISRRGKKMSFVMTARNAKMLGFAQMEAAQPIQPGALRPHRYMGSCTDCHIFMKTGGQLATDAGDILPNPPPITKNAKAPHRYRGQCATCHTIR